MHSYVSAPKRALVGLALAGVLVAPNGAHALTQAQIDAARAFLAQYRAGQTTMQQGVIPAVLIGTCPFTFSRNLTIGTTGADVQKLQKFLNSNSATLVAVSGAGSKGLETQYFGPATQAALLKFQAQHTLAATGIFDTNTRTKVNALCNPVVTVPQTPSNGNPQQPQTQQPPVKNPGKEAQLRNFKVHNAPSGEEVEEGSRAVDILSTSFEVRDADATLERMDISFISRTQSLVKEPWRSIQKVSVWADGKKLAEKSVTRKEDWNSQGSSVYQVRLSGLSLATKVGDDVDVIVAVEPVKNIDSNKLPQQWQVWVPQTGMRFRDTANITHSLGSDSAKKSFTLVDASDNDKLTIKNSSKNPEATVLSVKTNEKSKEQTVLSFDIAAEGSDIRVNTLPISIEVASGTQVTQVVQSMVLEVNGKKYKDYSLVNGTSHEAIATFDFDKELQIAEGKTENATLKVVLAKLSGNYAEGVDVQFSVTGDNVDAIDAEGARDLPEGKLNGSAYSREHTLRTFGVQSTKTTSSAEASKRFENVPQQGTYKLEFSVTAFNDTVYVPFGAGRVGSDRTTILSGAANGGVTYSLSQNSQIGVSGTSSAALSSDAKVQDGAFVVYEGETKKFVLNVSFTPDTQEYYALQLETINFRKQGESDASAAKHVVRPASQYRTEVVHLSVP